MTRRLTTFYSAIEALLVVGLGIAVPLSILTVMWAAHYGFQLDWLIFWQAAVIIWMLGHGVAVTFQLDAETAEALDLVGIADPIVITLALSGFALATVLAGVALGRRLRAQRHRILGELVAIGGVALLSALVMLSATNAAALPSRWQAVLFPTLAYGLGVAIGSIGATNPARVRLRTLIDDGPQPLTAALGAGLRAGLGAVASVVIAGSLLTTVVLVLGYGGVIALYEALQADVLGGVALTAMQLALLPTFVIWSSAWLIGPGFAIGMGSTVSPIGVSLGPLPALPVFGALPTEPSPLGFATLLVPVLAAFAAGLAVRQRIVRDLGDAVFWPWALATATVAAGVAAIASAFLAFVAAGSAGPGRLAEVGPDPLAIGLWMFAEAFVGVGLGLLAGGARAPRHDATARTR